MHRSPRSPLSVVPPHHPTAVEVLNSSGLERSSLAELGAALGQALVNATTVPTLLQTCVEAMVAYLPTKVAQIWVLDRNHQVLDLQAIAGDPELINDFESSIPLTCSIMGEMVQDHQRYINTHSHIDACLLHQPQAYCHFEDLTVFAGYPLLVNDQMIGVIALFGQEPLGDVCYDTLGWMVHSIAVGVDRLWAHQALRNRRETILLRLASQIRESLDLDVILDTTVTELRTVLSVDWCGFLWCLPTGDEATLMITHESRGVEVPSLLGDYPPQATIALSQPILALQGIVVDDALALEGQDPERFKLLTLFQTRSLLMVPLKTRSGQVGAILCGQQHSSRRWLERDRELLQAVVDQLAVAIDQAELYAKTQAAALAAETQAQQLSTALKSLRQTQSQLIQTEKMSSLGQMVAGIAHEINNPVNFINGNLAYADQYITDVLELLHLYQQSYPEPLPEIQDLEQDLEIDFLVEDLKKLLASMHVGSERIQQIVLSLRNFSRLDEAEMKAVDIHEGIESTLLILHNRIKDRGQQAPGIDIIRQYGDLPAIECYPSQLNQVFMNLLSNAIDALEEQPPPRQITIQTQVLADHPDGPKVEIRFRDNGPGMPTDVRDRVFDPFFTTKPVGKGTGLGLSISYQIIVEKHQGQVRCESELGQGTEFILTIPALTAG